MHAVEFGVKCVSIMDNIINIAKQNRNTKEFQQQRQYITSFEEQFQNHIQLR
jgi:hypothetical protein